MLDWLAWDKQSLVQDKLIWTCEHITTWKTGFGNRHRLPLVTGNAPVIDPVLQISQER
jgi:hypothetical protein